MYSAIYLTVTGILLGTIGLFNLLVDPFWYKDGNKITKINLTFNERVTKTNLLNREDASKYDCLILGSSRLTLLNTKAFKKNNCFNYSFSAGTAEEFPVYAKYAKEVGVNAKTVYVGIDGFNFLPITKMSEFKSEAKVPKTIPIYNNYFFSIDALKLSFRAITTNANHINLNDAREVRYYDQDFQGRVFSSAPKYEPKFVDKKTSEECDFSRVKYYKQIRNVFPNAEIVGYVAPVSAWSTYNDVYAKGLLNCQAQGIYNVSKNFNVTYDFSQPSEITTNPKHTYDGSHYYPYIHDQIAKVLEGEVSDKGIIVNKLTLEQYQQINNTKLKEFLQKQGKKEL